MRRSSNLPVKLAVAVALAAMSGAAAAAAPTLKEVLDASGITANGYVSASYIYSDELNTFHNYDVSRNGFQVDQAGLQVGFLPKEGFGAFANVIVGEDARLQNSFERTRDNGLGTDSDNAFNLTQAYVQYAGSGFTAILGKFVTLVGAEVIDPRANFNFSRSLLFAFEPSTHVGARVTVPLGDQFQVIAGINNGFNITSSSAGSKLGEIGLVYSPLKTLTISAQGYFGKDQNAFILDGQLAQREFADIVATWNATDALTFVLTGDYQRQKILPSQGLAPNGDNEARATGLAAYVNFKFSDQWRIAVRGEFLDDQDGFFTSGTIAPNGVAVVPSAQQTVSEGTVTLAYSPSENYELRIEGRYDMTTDKVLPKFDDAVKTTDNQTEIAVQALYKF